MANLTPSTTVAAMPAAATDVAPSPDIAPRPAWKEPLVWMVVGIPGLTIVAGLLTWWIAAQRADSDVADDHYRRGLAINRVLEREEAARARGLKAVITAPQAGAHQALQVRLDGQGTLPEAITVQLTHPVHAQEDRRFELAIQPDGSYRLPPVPTQAVQTDAAERAPWPASGRWSVSVEASQWRLTGQHITLNPGVTLSLPPASPERPGGRHATIGS